MMDSPLCLRSPSGSREPCHTTTVGNSELPKRPRCQWTRPTLPLRMAMRRAKTDGRHSSLALCLPLGASVNSRPGASSRPNTWCRCLGPQLSCQAPHCGSPGTASPAVPSAATPHDVLSPRNSISNGNAQQRRPRRQQRLPWGQLSAARWHSAPMATTMAGCWLRAALLRRAARSILNSQVGSRFVCC